MSTKLLPMYKLKPIEDPNTVYYYNSSMYGMRNINNLNLSGQTGSINSSVELSQDIYNEIEDSQKVILDYIASIKKQIEELKQILVKRSQGKVEINQNKVNDMTNNNKETGVVNEIVINCSINNPPYSLLALHKLTQDIRLNVTSHQHSTLQNQNKLLKDFEKLNSNDNSSYLFNVRLIWNENKGTTVTFGHVPLSGEVSLLRFIHSIVKPSLSLVDEIKLQELLDTLNNEGDVTFEKMINSNQYLVGNQLTVVDIGLWSLLKRKKVNGKLKQWYQHFDKLLS